MADIHATIDNYFIEMEWPFERIDEDLWLTAFEGDIQTHQVFVSTDEEAWVSFRTKVADGPAPECAVNLYEHLLRLNSLVPLTKFCIMENHDVFGMIDLPIADLDFSEFRTALQTLVNHVDAYDNEIHQICKVPDHKSSLGVA